LVNADIESHRLVQVLGPARICATGYWLVAGRDSLKRVEVSAFRDWIRTELGEAP
jgi:LysR family glycine cleavage system transcriptional activator